MEIKETNVVLPYTNEEIWFEWYLQELKTEGLIIRFFRPEPIQILSAAVLTVKSKKSSKVETLLQPLTYAPDFYVEWDTEHSNIDKFVKVLGKPMDKNHKNIPFYGNLTESGVFSLIEIKPNFNSSRAHSNTSFPIKQKFIYNLYQILVQKIVLFPNGKAKAKKELFPLTFTPQRFLFTDKNLTKRTIHFKTKSYDEYIESYE